jgi:gluconolactonase
MDIELVCEGLEFPEGPIAMADGSVILTEIKGQRLSRVHPNGRRETVVETGGGPNGAAIGPDGGIWITNNGGAFEWLENAGLTIPGPTPASHQGGMIQRFDVKSGKLETVYDSCDGKRLIGPNDLVFDPRAASGSPTMAAARPRAASTARSTTPRPTARRSASSAAT